MTFQLTYKRLYFDTPHRETCNDIWMSAAFIAAFYHQQPQGHIFIGSPHKPYRREVMNMEVKE
ncbi:hypothetical protein BCV73_11755 [Paenibacillus sp. SSG-1]|nr:hypothetical protein BCV73_11755 [Paenibacillus sp. SSG-1]